jgi:hypothetical protein
MGTSTIYKRMNDLGLLFKNMNKKDLKELEKLSPLNKEQWYHGWSCPMELHNGNVYSLVFWKGRLMKLEDAPKLLNKKYYDKYQGKTIKEYEWTLLKRLILNEINYLDKEFKKEIRKTNKKIISKTKTEK